MPRHNKERRKKSYKQTGKEKFQACWTCKNACGGCSWSRDFTPVEGWEAVPVVIPSNGEFAETYKIICCPKYERG